MKKQENVKAACCSRRQKIWGVIALAGLFACGLFVGATINGGGENRKIMKIGMTIEQCQSLSNQILITANHCGTGEIVSGIMSTSNDTCVAKLRELREIYNTNCEGRTVEEPEQTKPQPTPEDTADKPTCAVIESMMIGWLEPEDSTNPESHNRNIETYKKLINHGCPDNAEKYQALIQREQDILEALTGQTNSANKTCSEIESLLMQNLPTFDLNISDVRIERAKIYANLSERGCPENSQQYVNLAAKELEIARALRDDKFDQQETVEVVETYKRLEMQQTAREVLDKVQKLTDPAIDFIIQVQKIIEE